MTLPLTQLSIPQLVDAGVLAYKSRDFKIAIEYLLAACDQEPRNWRAKLYLGMSYFHSGDQFLAVSVFRFLKDNCTDAEIRQKADSAMNAINSAVQSNKMPEMTCTIKKPKLKEPDQERDDELEVIRPEEHLRRYT